MMDVQRCRIDMGCKLDMIITIDGKKTEKFIVFTRFTIS